jgi:Lhr-like helicase
LDEDEKVRFDAEVRREEHQEVGTMIQTLSEAMRDSEARGEARGELRATRRAILLMTKENHEALPAGFEEHLNAIDDLERLFKILEQVPRVASLDEIVL